MKPNLKILNPKIVIFLGAGFSNVVNYPTMGEFVKKHLGKSLDLETRSIISAIKIAKETDDLEVVLSELDKMSDTKYCFNLELYLNSTKEVRSKQIDSAYKDETKKNIILNYRKPVIYSIDRTIRLIKKRIFEVYRPKSGLDYTIYDAIFKPIFNINKIGNTKKFALSIFTTNYDNVIEDYFESNNQNDIDIVNGFGRNRKFNPKIFERYSIKDRNRVFIFHLHGSIYFFEDKDFKCIRFSEIPTYQEDANYKNQIIYPTKDKTPKDEPFLTYYNYLSRLLDVTEYVIFIGYSFRDYESLVRIQSSLNYNDKLRVIIVDNKAKELKKKYFNNIRKVYSLEYHLISNNFTTNFSADLKKIIKSDDN